ncbi:MAG: LPD38 domain-containing protein, partial [Thermodesulfobacteriota bacterium]|nr:LPD38 domain-containing protein [Thermodesulfobacteriota bacterium]
EAPTTEQFELEGPPTLQRYLDAATVKEEGIKQKDIPTSIKAKIGIPEKGLANKIKDTFSDIKDNWRTRFFDKLAPIKGLSNTAYMLHRLETGVQVPISMLMNHGRLEWEGKALVVNTRKEGFLPFLNSLGEDGEKLFYWVAAKRAEALESEGREKWLTEDVRKDIFKWVGKTDKYWNELNDKFQEFNKSVLDLATKAGIIDPVLRKTWEQDYYVPFYRVFENETTKEEFLKGPYKNNRHIDAQIRRLTGKEEKIGDLTTNIIKNWSHLIHESVRNVARSEAFNAATKLGKNTGLLDESGNPIPIIQRLDKKDLIRVLGSKTEKQWGTVKEGSKRASAIFDTKEEAEAWAYYLEDKSGKKYRVDQREKTSILFGRAQDYNILSFREKGKPIYFRVNDPELFNALSNINNEKFNNFIMKMFSTTKHWLTYGATFGPAFRVANMLRDTLHTTVISKSFAPFIDSFRGFAKALKEDQDWIKVAAGGGTFGGSYVRAEDAQSLAKYINKIIKKEGEGAVNRILDTPKKLLAFWDKIGAASEDAARVSLYSKRRAKGVSHLEAAFESRDLLDFTMRGDASVVQFLIQSIPFMNARMQGLYKLGRAAKQDPKSFALKGGAITLATMLLWAINKDKDEWNELEDWDKWTYYHFWIGDKHFRVPKPFEVGAVFSSLFESAADTMADNEDFGFFMDFVLATFMDTFAVNPVPQMLRPLAEQWANKSFFTGRPIEGMALKRLKPGERKTPWTSETMQLAGKIGIPPKRAEELVRGYFATFGMFLLGMSDIAIHQFADFPHAPSKVIEEYPLVGRFVRRRKPARYNKYMTRFYDIFKEIDEINATINNYRRLGDFESAKKLALKNKKKLRLKAGISRAQRRLAEINRQIKQVMASKIRSPENKRVKIDALIKKRNIIAKKAYESYKEI